MSVTEFNKDLNVAIIDQKLFLKSVYGNIKEIEDLLESFEIKTPFRMDLEAEKMSKKLVTCACLYMYVSYSLKVCIIAHMYLC